MQENNIPARNMNSTYDIPQIPLIGIFRHRCH